MKNLRYKFIFIIIIFLSSCEKDISVELPRPEKKITVEGFIEINEYPIVFLTKNSAYFDAVDTTFVNNLIISGNEATIIVTDAYNSTIDTLLAVDTFPRWPYKGYQGTKIKGQTGGVYDLKIIYNNQTYTSTTTIRDIIGIDSVWYTKPFKSDSLGYLSINWKNPSGYGDYFAITLKMSWQGWFFRPAMTHVINDKFLEHNEKIVMPYITKAYERNSYNRITNTDDIDWLDFYLYKKNDTVSIKLSTIDEAAFIFWDSWYRNKSSEGNPFTNPASVKSNIKGDNVNGYWIGYGSYIKTIYIDEEYKIITIDP